MLIQGVCGGEYVRSNRSLLLRGFLALLWGSIHPGWIPDRFEHPGGSEYYRIL